ncbi:helix-turn-helix domain-containing protein [Sulfobacillus harzensis]|uniref:Helix-turn-helix transcriptional regulator n=1 Tax=Sulfobacillus harzensis TaxID=2729629 RepID=A0A7Y0L221_9FIRM|nr:helix-turn-helix transcriptional regulator [Sulfobacillus harzensis]NMP21867.1 helix-turn-helix transcriptional regulator [Sulfobacillus harzensis]
MNQIRRLRQLRGMTQEELAMAANCGRSFLSQIENGKANPTEAVYKEIAKALRVPLSQLFVDDSPTPTKTRTVE